MSGEHDITCRTCYELLFSYLEGEVPAEVCAGLDEHFRQCPPCRQFLVTYRATPGLARDALAKEVPAEVTDALHAFLRSKIGNG